MTKFPTQRQRVHWALWRLALFAEWLDRRRQRWCWASIATDLGFGWDVWHWRANAKESVRNCLKECDDLGYCWCGKFRQSDERVQAIWEKRRTEHVQ